MTLYAPARENSPDGILITRADPSAGFLPYPLDLDSRIGGEGKGKRTNGFRPDARVLRPTAHTLPLWFFSSSSYTCLQSTHRIRLGTKRGPRGGAPSSPSTGSTAREVGSAKTTIWLHIIQGQCRANFLSSFSRKKMGSAIMLRRMTSRQRSWWKRGDAVWQVGKGSRPRPRCSIARR